MRTGTGSALDCRIYDGQVLGLYWTILYAEEWYWFCSGPRRTDTWSVLDCRVNVGLVLGL